jgi:dTDP-4-amino-4,6-dideoxygalactose transaminase
VCFSFHPRKVITTGDGGMITTNNEAYYDRLKLLRQHGMSVNDRVRHNSTTVIMEDHMEVGYNYRLTDIQAAVGIKQLERLDWIVTERRKIAERYQEAFKNIDFIRLPVEPKDYVTNWQSYVIYLKPNSPVKRNDLMQLMLDKGISTRRGVMTTHRESAYKNYKLVAELPVSVDASDNSVVLPLYVPMNEEEINYVIKTLKSVLGI